MKEDVHTGQSDAATRGRPRIKTGAAGGGSGTLPLTHPKTPVSSGDHTHPPALGVDSVFLATYLDHRQRRRTQRRSSSPPAAPTLRTPAWLTGSPSCVWGASTRRRPTRTYASTGEKEDRYVYEKRRMLAQLSGRAARRRPDTSAVGETVFLPPTPNVCAGREVPATMQDRRMVGA